MNGSPVATLNRGEFYQTILSEPAIFTANEPILVVQYETSESYQPTSVQPAGDPSMILVPPYEQYGGHYTVGTPASGFNSDYVNVVVPTAAIGTVQLDGAAVSSSGFNVIGSSGYSGSSIQVSPGSHRFTATAPFGVTLYGYFPEDTFGYQGGMSLDTAAAGTSISVIPNAVTQLTGTQLATVTDNRLLAQGATSGLTTYNYDAVGNLQNFMYPNGVTSAYTYDTLNRLTQMGASSNTAAISNYAYTLGLAGNRTSVAELSGRTVGYAYDALYRLTTETVSGDLHNNNGVGSYTYDAVGNRKTLNTTIPPAGGNSYTYDADDRLGSDQYDADGNTINSLGTANSYDFENHMIAHGAVTVVYDGDGNRVSETVGGVTTSYLVDTANPTGYAQVVDEVQSGTVTRTYAYGLERISENQKISSAWTPSFYGYDGHGSVRQLTNTAGAVTDTYDHDAFGNLVSSTGTTPNVYLFAGEAYDSALGLYYNRARYLNTTTGRFWSMDTYKGDKWRPTTLHRYSYAWNNPPNVVDPSGLDGDIATEEVTETVGVVEDTMPVVETAPIIEAFEEPEVVAEAPQVASGFQKAVAYLLLGTAALGTAAGVGGTGNQVPIDQEVAEASQGNYDIYRLGNSTKLYDLRQGADYTLNTQGLIDPQNPAMNSDYRGASAFRDPWFRPWPKYPTGYAYRIPLQAIYDANGLGVIPDAAKFAPDVPVGAGHHTIYPTEQMTPQDLDQRIRSLPWVITPPRIK
jgi:RHS repeat-associated protein